MYLRRPLLYLPRFPLGSGFGFGGTKTGNATTPVCGLGENGSEMRQEAKIKDGRMIATRYVEDIPIIEDGPDGRRVRMISQTLSEAAWVPRGRTALGEDLMRIRDRITASGAKLLGWEDIEKLRR